MPDKDQEIRDQNLYERLYRSVLRIRLVEEEISRIYHTDKVKSPVHLSVGQEAVSVGVCDVLRHDDVVFGTYRGHALYLAKGGDLNRMVAELFGKETGCAGGKAGSMHLIDTGANVMGTSAIVATTIPQAIGYAFALKSRNSDAIVVSFFGDAAIEEGACHESLNFAALWRLPILFVCENNFYAIFTPLDVRQPQGIGICRRVESYGIAAICIEDGDILKTREEAAKAVDAIRKAKSGPRFMECMTYRWKEHVGPGEDWDLGYRSEEEARSWKENDQVARLAGLLDEVTRKRVENEVAVELEEAFAFAENSDFPPDKDLYTHVFQP